MSFLTIEDVNSTLSKFGDINTFYTIDTSSVIANQGKTYVDFCEIELNDSNDYNYTVKVFNQLWTGGCYLLDANNNPITVPIVYDDGELTFTTSENNVKLVLYLCNLASEFHFEQQTLKTDIESLYYLKEQTDTPTFVITTLRGERIRGEDYLTFKFNGEEISGLIVNGVVDYYLANGIIEVNYQDNTFYYRATQTKQVLPLTIQDTLIVGKVNTVNIDYPSDLDLTVETAIVKYKNTEFEIDLTEKSFELDLTGKTSDTPVTIYLKVNETEDLMEYEYKFKIPCKYYEVDNFEAFKSELENILGARIINLTSSITFDSRILINHNVKLLCDFNTLNLNEFGFDLKEGINSIIKQGLFDNGDTVFFQEENSKLELFECTFSESTSTRYNNLGSVIFCDIDIENLQYNFDFTTNIDECIFINNHSTILHGGQLNITNSKFHNTDINVADNSNPAFLYQVDGNARLTNNVFDIDYDSNQYCQNQKNIGFAQCVLVVGKTAIVNGLSHFELEENIELPFFDVNYSNRSHVFCKYYYPQINDCVYSSPLPSKEDKAVCYAVSGNNWVFKQGVVVSRVDAGNENTNRVMEW